MIKCTNLNLPKLNLHSLLPAKRSISPDKVMNKADQYKIIRAVFACPNGIQRMSQAMKGLVETSNNLAIVRCSKGKFEAHNLTRSSVDSAKESTAWKIAAVFHLIDAKVYFIR